MQLNKKIIIILAILLAGLIIVPLLAINLQSDFDLNDFTPGQDSEEATNTVEPVADVAEPPSTEEPSEPEADPDVAEANYGANNAANLNLDDVPNPMLMPLGYITGSCDAGFQLVQQVPAWLNAWIVDGCGSQYISNITFPTYDIMWSSYCSDFDVQPAPTATSSPTPTQTASPTPGTSFDDPYAYPDVAPNFTDTPEGPSPAEDEMTVPSNGGTSPVDVLIYQEVNELYPYVIYLPYPYEEAQANFPYPIYPINGVDWGFCPDNDIVPEPTAIPTATATATLTPTPGLSYDDPYAYPDIPAPTATATQVSQEGDQLNTGGQEGSTGGTFVQPNYDCGQAPVPGMGGYYAYLIYVPLPYPYYSDSSNQATCLQYDWGEGNQFNMTIDWVPCEGDQLPSATPTFTPTPTMTSTPTPGTSFDDPYAYPDVNPAGGDEAVEPDVPPQSGEPDVAPSTMEDLLCPEINMPDSEELAGLYPYITILPWPYQVAPGSDGGCWGFIWPYPYYTDADIEGNFCGELSFTVFFLPMPYPFMDSDEVIIDVNPPDTEPDQEQVVVNTPIPQQPEPTEPPVEPDNYLSVEPDESLLDDPENDEDQQGQGQLNLDGSETLMETFILTWTISGVDYDEFHLQRLDDQTWETIFIGGQSTFSYEDVDVVCGRMYEYRVLAVSGGTSVAVSNTVFLQITNCRESGWHVALSSPGVVFNDVIAFTDQEAWTVGVMSDEEASESLILHYDGYNWVVEPADCPEQLFAIDMLNDRSGWVAGGLFMEHADDTWQNSMDEDSMMFGVDLASEDDGWAVGEQGKILHWSGSGWTEHTTLSTVLYDIAVYSDTFGFAVGENGLIAKWDGTYWDDIDSPVTAPLYGVDIISETQAWAVGENGTILSWDGNVWSQFQSPVSTTLNDIAMVGGFEGWIVGNDGVTLHWDGSAWKLVLNRTNSDLYAVSMSSVHKGWAVGADGTILRYNTAEPDAVLPVEPHDTMSEVQAFVWYPVGNAVEYEWMLLDGEGQSLYAETVSPSDVNCMNNYNLCTLSVNIGFSTGDYSWKVRAWNDLGYGDWSRLMAFTLE
jgi:hypothetical protein